MQQLLYVFLHLPWLLGSAPESAGPLNSFPENCAAPLITSVNSTSTTSVDVAWFDISPQPEDLYAIEIIEAGLQPSGDPTIDSISGSSIEVADLESGTAYNIYIRKVCSSEISAWSSTPVLGITLIDNANSCALQIPISDDSCPEPDVFGIFVDADPTLKLGIDLRLTQVTMSAIHPWVADLNLMLESPSGKIIQLARHRGGTTQNIGENILLPCAQPFVFADFACTSVTSKQNYSGSARPEESFNTFEDSTSATGVWYLRICDRAIDDIGMLQHIKLIFDNVECTEPPDLLLIDETASSALFELIASSGIDSFDIMTSPMHTDSLVGVDSIFTAGSGTYVQIDSLIPGYTYQVSIRSICGDEFSPWSCPMSIATPCGTVSTRSDFNNVPLCDALCSADCEINDSIWHNVAYDDRDWIVFSGATPTPGTGPGSDRTGHGQYLYMESSGSGCTTSDMTILESNCLFVDADSSQCEIRFMYHMSGDSIGTLNIEVSPDEGLNWESVWMMSGDHGNQWIAAYIELDTFDGKFIQLRINATTAGDVLGDIGIDDILLSGLTLEQNVYYADFDGDGFGSSDSIVLSCTNAVPSGYVLIAGDCDDNNDAIYPGAPEVACNLLDDNCNGEIDENQPASSLHDTLIQISNSTCSGIDNGVISLMAIGGVSPYQYFWNTGDTTNEVQNLPAGMYSCIISDSVGCAYLRDSLVVINEVDFSIDSIDAISPSCFGIQDGAINISLEGGAGSIDYQWNTGDTTSEILNLNGGIYSVTATDSLGCQAQSIQIEIETPATFNIDVVSHDSVTCHGINDGRIALQTNGDTSGIDYIWSNGDTTAVIDSLPPGLYSCTVTDTMGCISITDSIEITSPESLSIHIERIVNPDCINDLSGQIQVYVTGGTPPYSYLWSNGEVSSTNSFLGHGTYIVTVTDANACSVISDSVAIIDPPEILVERDTILDAFCPSSPTGLVKVKVTGGSPPYYYVWSNGVRNSDQIDHVTSGEYSVTVTDSRGCKNVLKTGLDVGALNDYLNSELTQIEQIQCFGASEGSILVTLDTATLPVIFHWSNGSQWVKHNLSDTLGALAAGDYSVTMTDGTGCVSISDIISIDQPSAIGYNAHVTDNYCFGLNDGIITLNQSGGTPPYRTVWSNGDTTDALLFVSPGTYTASITDANACQLQVGPLFIAAADSVRISFTTESATNGMANGIAQASVDGGSPPYAYQWGPESNNQNGETATNLVPGWHYLTITDSKPCTYSDSVFVDQINSVNTNSRTATRVYPNPAKETLTIDTQSPFNSASLIDVRGVSHTLIASEIAMTSINVNIRTLAPGFYYLKLDGQSSGIKIIVIQ